MKLTLGLASLLAFASYATAQEFCPLYIITVCPEKCPKPTITFTSTAVATKTLYIPCPSYTIGPVPIPIEGTRIAKRVVDIGPTYITKPLPTTKITTTKTTSTPHCSIPTETLPCSACVSTASQTTTVTYTSTVKGFKCTTKTNYTLWDEPTPTPV